MNSIKNQNVTRSADVGLVVFIRKNLVYQRGVVVKGICTSGGERMGNTSFLLFKKLLPCICKKNIYMPRQDY